MGLKKTVDIFVRKVFEKKKIFWKFTALCGKELSYGFARMGATLNESESE